MDIIGKRVKIIDSKHPHYGETGTIESIEKTICGYGLIIKLDNCPLKTKSCFIFDSKEINFI